MEKTNKGNVLSEYDICSFEVIILLPYYSPAVHVQSLLILLCFQFPVPFLFMLMSVMYFVSFSYI